VNNFSQMINVNIEYFTEWKSTEQNKQFTEHNFSGRILYIVVYTINNLNKRYDRVKLPSTLSSLTDLIPHRDVTEKSMICPLRVFH